ncbi:bile acid:sodium symporter family protein [Gracilimonas halophila]|uniref:Peptidase MA superfamily protein n=1 Tax=Gracilimonas halophila TaxID=1834464 RepID=A0ABW5JHX8_9BACT
MKKASPYIPYILFGIALLFVPLLRDFHFESAMLAGTIGCFWAGIQAADSTSKQDFFDSLRILGVMYLAAIPLFIFALISGCLTIDGVGFWIFIPLPSVFLGAAIGRLVRKLWIPFPKTVTVFILMFCAVGIWLIEFFSFPQVYFYNHVWGVWPGPIFDEAVILTGSFFYFRWLTFLWIVLLWVLPEWSKNLQTKLITALALISLLFSYLNLDEAGIISPQEAIQQQLGGFHQTTHFDLYYDEKFYSEDEVEYWSARHEFYFREILEQLDIEWPKGQKVDSYLYAHAWQKKKITGAKFTSYVPIWLEQDQLHIAKQQLNGVLKHELVHVISKQFGNALFNGSWNIGLIEGLAEGIAEDASARSTLNQIVAAERPWPSAEDMQSALSFWGFYESAGSISYTTTGSFIAYLLDEYPVDDLKEAYRSSNIEAAYSQPLEKLISEWHQQLEDTQLDTVDRQISELIFAQRSLFQKECPHSITKEMRLWDTYRYHLAEEDTGAAYKTLGQLYTLDSKNALVKDAWTRAQLDMGDFDSASKTIRPEDSLLTLQVLKADAMFLQSGYQKADSLLQTISDDIRSSNSRTLRFTLEMREDSLQWHYHTARRYLNWNPDSVGFLDLNLPNQMLTLNKALQDGRHELVLLYAELLKNHSPSSDWFDVYEDVIDRLAYRGNYELAETWIMNIDSLNLRLRYEERIKEVIKWVDFLKTYNEIAD